MRRRSPVWRGLAAVVTLGLTFACGAERPPTSAISPQELLAAAGKPDAPLVLDVRSAEEFASGRVPGARNVVFDEVSAQLASLGPPREVVVYCESGGRAERAALVLREAGFAVRELTGHMRGWREQQLPLER